MKSKHTMLSFREWIEWNRDIGFLAAYKPNVIVNCWRLRSSYRDYLKWYRKPNNRSSKMRNK
jgi:hypothetical protein